MSTGPAEGSNPESNPDIISQYFCLQLANPGARIGFPHSAPHSCFCTTRWEEAELRFALWSTFKRFLPRWRIFTISSGAMATQWPQPYIGCRPGTYPMCLLPASIGDLILKGRRSGNSREGDQRHFLWGQEVEGKTTEEVTVLPSAPRSWMWPRLLTRDDRRKPQRQLQIHRQ